MHIMYVTSRGIRSWGGREVVRVREDLTGRIRGCCLELYVLQPMPTIAVASLWLLSIRAGSVRCRGRGDGRWLRAYEGRSSCSCRARVGRQRAFDRGVSSTGAGVGFQQPLLQHLPARNAVAKERRVSNKTAVSLTRQTTLRCGEEDACAPWASALPPL